MNFEKQLNEMYQEIANHINDMIPTEWEQVYTMAYIDEGGGEVFLITLHLLVTTYIIILLFQMIIMFHKRYLVIYLSLSINYLKGSESYL